tara:strand:- start:400 stop:735 length:336 start_codon:yes stop_codon:yes gene_type:complete
MKLTRHELKNLIQEAIKEKESLLLEFPGGMGSARMGPNAPEHEGEEKDQNEGSMTRQELFHLGEKANQLHALISDQQDLEPWVQSKITKAAENLGTVFDYLTYKQKNPGER